MLVVARRTAASASSGGSRPAGESSCRASCSRPSNSGAAGSGRPCGSGPAYRRLSARRPARASPASAAALAARLARPSPASPSPASRIGANRPHQLVPRFARIRAARPACSPARARPSFKPGIGQNLRRDFGEVRLQPQIGADSLRRAVEAGDFVAAEAAVLAHQVDSLRPASAPAARGTARSARARPLRDGTSGSCSR